MNKNLKINSAFNFSLRQLDIFKAVAETGSIRAAARAIELSQPAVTLSIKELESIIGCSLFERGTSGVSLTKCGDALLRHAYILLNDVERAQREIFQLRDGMKGKVTVGLSPAAYFLLPKAIDEFRFLRPDVEIEIQEINWPRMDGRWRRGEYDFAVVSEWKNESNDGYIREFLLEVPLYIKYRKNHPLEGGRHLSDFLDFPWVMKLQRKDLLECVFLRNNLPIPKNIIMANQVGIACTILRNSDAIAVMAKDSDDIGLVTGVDLDISPLVTTRVNVLTRSGAGGELSPAAKVFMDCFRQSSQIYLGESRLMG